jgi:hypothetical protein
VRWFGLLAVVLIAAACGSTAGVPTVGPISSSIVDSTPTAGATTDVNVTACTRFDISPCTAAHYRLCGPGGPDVTTNVCNGGPDQVRDLAPPGPKASPYGCLLTATGLAATIEQYDGGSKAATQSCTSLKSQLSEVAWRIGGVAPRGLGYVCTLYAPERESAVEVRAVAAQAALAADACARLSAAGWTGPAPQ